MSETFSGARPITELSRDELAQYLGALRFGPGPAGIRSPYSEEELRGQLDLLTQQQRALLDVGTANRPFLGMEGDLPGSMAVPPAPGVYSPGMGLLTPEQPPAPAQPATPLPPVQERQVRPAAEVVSVPRFVEQQPQPQAQPAPVAAPPPAARQPERDIGNTLMGLAAIQDAFAILGGRQPTALAQMAPVAQQRSQQQALNQILAARSGGALTPQQATILGQAVQQAGVTAGTQAAAAPGQMPAGGGFTPRGLAINTRLESGGQADARNPLSTAMGANQFIEGTWLEFARANPELFPNMNREQILARRADADLSAQATQWNARRNSEILENANLPVNDATLGMAHMFGATGARQLLRADVGARMEDVVGTDVLRANPNLAGRTVGQVVQGFVQNYGLPQAQQAPLTPAQAQIAGAPGGGASLRRQVEITPELAATLRAMPAPDALRLLAQLDLQSQQRGTRILSATEARAVLGEAADPNKVYQVGAEGGITVVPGTRESEEPTRQQRVSLEGELRTQFGAQKPVQEFLQMGPQIRAIRDGVARETPSRLNDINLTFAFAKMLDPTSVVRENEAGQIVASASVMDRLGGFIARLNGGAAFSPELRAQLLREAESRYSSAREAYDVEADAYRDLARGYGVEPARVIPPRRDLPEARPIPGTREAQAGGAISEAQRPAAIADLTARVQSGAVSVQAARDIARQLGIPNAERLFQ